MGCFIHIWGWETLGGLPHCLLDYSANMCKYVHDNMYTYIRVGGIELIQIPNNYSQQYLGITKYWLIRLTRWLHLYLGQIKLIKCRNDYQQIICSNVLKSKLWHGFVHYQVYIWYTNIINWLIIGTNWQLMLHIKKRGGITSNTVKWLSYNLSRQLTDQRFPCRRKSHTNLSTCVHTASHKHLLRGTPTPRNMHLSCTHTVYLHLFRHPHQTLYTIMQQADPHLFTCIYTQADSSACGGEECNDDTTHHQWNICMCCMLQMWR